MFPDLTRDDVFRIETRRLWLRWPCARDADAIVRLAGERQVADMTARIPHPIEPAGIDSYIIEARRRNTEGEALVLALTPKSSPVSLIGMIGVEPDSGAGAPHLGYWLGRPYWGERLMGEAVTAKVENYFAYAGGTALSSTCLIENPVSRRVLERAGFRHCGDETRAMPARGGDRQVHCFELTRAEWARRVAETES